MMARIEFEKPPGASVDDIAEFINDALSSWGGQFHPEDPLFSSLRLKKLQVNGKQFKLEETQSGT